LGELDFAAIVRAAGKRELQRRYSAVWKAKYGATMPENAFDTLVDGVLEVVAKVTAFERMMAH
jgi:hypothetical protein